MNFDPRMMGLLAAAGAGLEASGPSRMPVSTGQVISRGLLSGMNAYQGAQDQELKRGLLGAQMGHMKQQDMLIQAQIAEAQRKSTLEQQRMGMLNNYISGLLRPVSSGQAAMGQGAAVGDVGPTVGNAARMDGMSGPQRAMINPDDLLPLAAAGVNVDPFLKIRDANMPKIQDGMAIDPSRLQHGQFLPTVRDQDIGGSIRTLQRNADGTERVVSDTPRTAAPSALPFWARRDANGNTTIDPVAFGAQQGLASASATRLQNNVNAFTPASEEAQKEFMKSSRVNYERLRDAPSQIANIEKAKALIPKAAPFVGSFGEKKLAIAQFLNNNIGTDIKADQIANAGELRTRVFNNIMDNLKKMDAQPSQMQQQIMMDALGKLDTDPRALGQMLDAYSGIIKDKVVQYNREVTSASGRGVKFPYDPVIDMRRGGSDDPLGLRK